MANFRLNLLGEKISRNILKYKKWLFILTIALVSFWGGLLARDLYPVASVNNEFIRRPAYIQALLKFGGKQVLNTLITEKLILQEAEKRHLNIPQSEINEKISLLEKQLKLNNSTLESFLVLQGKTKLELEKEIKLQLIIEKLFKEEVKITDLDIENYFIKQRIRKGAAAILESQKIAINRILYQAKLRERLYAWLLTQQKNSKVKIFIKM